MPVKMASELVEMARQLLEGVGVAVPVAARLAAHLVDADLSGMDSHGMIQLPFYLRCIRADRIAREDRTEVLAESGITALLDGHLTIGPVVADKAVALASDKALRNGAGVVSARNSAHIGRLGEYAEHLARQDLIGCICCTAQGGGQSVAPWGSHVGRLGTNPIAWGIPCSTHPLVLDMATAATAAGKILTLQRRGETMPLGWAVDASGQPVTDPGVFGQSGRGAVLLPAGVKGFGLALVVEALAGALSGGGCVRPGAEYDSPTNSFTVLAIDVSRLQELRTFADRVAEFVAYVKAATPTDPAHPVLVPNDLETRTRQERLSRGIPLDDDTWDSLLAAERDFGSIGQARR